MTEISYPRLVERLRAAGCVFAEEEATLLIDEVADAAALESLVARRVAGEPLEYLLGWALFCGLRIAVEPGVFVPRHRTEFLVRTAAALTPAGAVVLDLCCGSGALAAALRSLQPTIEVHATDIDPVAVEVARRNLPGAASVIDGDLFASVPALLMGRFDTILANTPYVPTDAIALMPPEARDYELRATLDGGIDGLDLQRRVAAEAPHWLAPGGSLLVEASERQAEASAAVMRAAGLEARIEYDDDLEATIVIGVRLC